ncbi:hypothetical protein [Shewanella sp. GXUN23E]|uniref:hypothetical protein n=1 Tax=Shewanella sp. GXUN23E TaxID=3422498 RepID=UPI003D7E88AA
MKNKILISLTGLTALASSFVALAHDPAAHSKMMEKPDCSAMKTMDHSKMDMNDPVTMAMMKQCAAQEKAAGSKPQPQTSTPPAKQPAEKSHNGHQH